MEIFSHNSSPDRWLEGLKGEEIYYNVNGFDFLEKFESIWDSSSYRFVNLRPNFKMEIRDELYYRSFGIEGDHSDLHTLVSRFYLSGCSGVSSPNVEGVAANYEEKGGYNYLFYLPDIKETEYYYAGDRIHAITIRWDAEFLRAFVGSSHSLPQRLRPFSEGDAYGGLHLRGPRFHCTVGSITPAMRIVLHEICNTSHQGIAQRMFLESKALELLALQLDQLAVAEGNNLLIPRLKPRDVEQIYQAREILLTQWLEPPSVCELAQQVKCDRKKLMQGFRQVFGTTLFSYLRDYRMEQARQLLQERECNVLEAANAVGYSNTGHFAAAFKRKYGITPRECLVGNKPIPPFGIEIPPL